MKEKMGRKEMIDCMITIIEFVGGGKPTLESYRPVTSSLECQHASICAGTYQPIVVDRCRVLLKK